MESVDNLSLSSTSPIQFSIEYESDYEPDNEPMINCSDSFVHYQSSLDDDHPVLANNNIDVDGDDDPLGYVDSDEDIAFNPITKYDDGVNVGGVLGIRKWIADVEMETIKEEDEEDDEEEELGGWRRGLPVSFVIFWLMITTTRTMLIMMMIFIIIMIMMITK